MIGRRWMLGALRRRWGWVTGTALLTGFLGVPMVWGNTVLPVDIPLLDNVAWLPNDATGDVVRVNGETSDVDARLDIGPDGTGSQVEQAEGVALVEIDGRVRSIDVAQLEWGVEVPAEGEVVVGDGAAFLVRRDGRVRALDPETLAPSTEVQLEAELSGPGVVAGHRLVVPGVDGRLYVVDGEGRATSVAAGDPGVDMRVSLVGDQVVVVNLTAGQLRRFEMTGGVLSYAGEVSFDVPEGEVIVPPRLPAGRLWLLAQRSGELYAIDVTSGDVASTQVTDPRTAVAGPVVAGGRVYVVDRAAGRLVEVDVETLEVVHQEDLEVEDASEVDIVAQGETVFVNDRASSEALVVNGDDRQRVDKYGGGDVPGDDAPDQPAPPTSPRPPDPGPRPDDRRSDDDRPRNPGPSTTIVVVPGVPGVPGSTTTIAPATTTTTRPPTTTTTRPPTPPGAVTGLTATAGDGTVTLQWGAAASPSPLPVTYTIAVSPAAPGGTTFTTTALSRTFTGLTNGVTYRFTVTPTNDDGTGAAAQTDATPVAPEVGPTISSANVYSASGGGFEVTVTYNSGSGSNVTCMVHMTGGEALGETCPPGASSVTIGTFDIPPGECREFRATVTTSIDSTTLITSGCAPAAPTTTTTALQPTVCVDEDGNEFPCYVTPAGS